METGVASGNRELGSGQRKIDTALRSLLRILKYIKMYIKMFIPHTEYILKH